MVIRTVILAALLSAPMARAFGAGGGYPSDPVASALRAAGSNRAEIERALDHYANDAEKLDAVRWLIGHMIGKAYKVVTVTDRSGKDAGFDALKYPDLNAALDAYDAIERLRGPLQQKVTAYPDLERLKAAFLIEHVDRAFEAWRTLPWARDVTYRAFRDYVLPYRSGKEPAEAWRAELMARYAGLPSKMKSAADLREAAGLISADIGAWVGFWDLYYMHPTEQGFSEMKRSLKGRCGDLSNLATMALRANGIPCAIDYTPYWADTGNNHAWPVVLDQNGSGHEVVGKAAKVYRKTFANQPGNLIYDVRRGEAIPPWLDRPDYVDVTTQYLPTTDVRLLLGRKAPHAYLCVFNDGEWRPIQWSRVGADGAAVFAAMGRDILYLPATYGKSGLRAAGAPFVLSSAGNVTPCAARPELPIQVTVAATSRGAARRAAVRERRGRAYARGADEAVSADRGAGSHLPGARLQARTDRLRTSRRQPAADRSVDGEALRFTALGRRRADRRPLGSRPLRLGVSARQGARRRRDGAVQRAVSVGARGGRSRLHQRSGPEAVSEPHGRGQRFPRRGPGRDPRQGEALDQPDQHLRSPS